MLHAVPVTVGFSAQGSGGALGTSGGAELPVGSKVMVGTFDLTPAQVIAAGNDHFTLLASFHPLASTVIGTFNGVPQNASGAFSASVTIDSAGNSGKRIYVWAFNAATISDATSHVLLSSPAWTVPGFGSINCETSQIPFSDPSSVVISTRQAGVTSPTLGGILNQAIPLTHPDGSDHDKDGIPALLEWATGSDPGIANPSPLVLQNGNLSLPRFPGTAGNVTDFSNNLVHYSIETSENLGTWQLLPAASVSSSNSISHPQRPGMELLTLQIAPDTAPKRFWRLGVARK
jgi:hypothetical protein